MLKNVKAAKTHKKKTAERARRQGKHTSDLKFVKQLKLPRELLDDFNVSSDANNQYSEFLIDIYIIFFMKETMSVSVKKKLFDPTAQTNTRREQPHDTTTVNESNQIK